MFTDTVVIVGISKIDCDTQSVSVQKNDTGAWIFQLPISAADAATQAIDQLPETVKNCVNTVIITSLQGDSHGKNLMFEQEKVQKKLKCRPSIALAGTGATLPVAIMKHLPSAGDVFQVESACASSIKALELAVILAQHKQQLILIAGVDFSTSPYVLFSFNSLGALAVGDKYSSPFDTARSGCAIGECAAMLAVCTQSFADKNNLKILAIVDAAGSFSQCSHHTHPTSPDLVEKFLETVVHDSGRYKSEFAYWDAHATATPVGDYSEYQIFSKMFDDIPISSYKGHAGHCMGACGAVEIVNAIENLQQGVIPATKGIVSPMIEDSRIITIPVPTTLKTFIKCSFGFGGRNGAAVITVI
jgi:3-oxoacyl-(acyl-carrier-protein) synthase